MGLPFSETDSEAGNLLLLAAQVLSVAPQVLLEQLQSESHPTIHPAIHL